MKSILYKAKAINRNPNRTYRTDYENGDWVYGLVSKLYKYDDKYFAEMTNTDGVSGIDIDRETICEYTGLTDKNGNKIFEGDIVITGATLLLGNLKGTVEYSSTSARYIISFKDKVYHYEDLTKAKIIGNIYDNPELLEK